MVWYNRGKLLVLNPAAAVSGTMDLAADEIHIGLMVAGYSLNIDTHLQYDDITTSGIVATDYTEPGAAGSHTLAGVAFAQDDANDRGELDATDLTFTGIGNGSNDTFDQIVVCRSPTAGHSEANTELIAHSAVASTTTNNGDITLVWNAEGILHVTT